MIWPDELPLLKRGRVHEVISGDSTSGIGVTASVRAFAALQAVAQPTGARHERGRATPDDAVIWVSQPPRRRNRGASTRLDPYGLADFFDPGRLILLEARQPIDVFWAAEECLRSGAAPLVVAEPATVADLTASRRLQLAAEAGGALGLLLYPAPPNGRTPANAAETRWRCEAAPSWSAGRLDRVWVWRCLKNKRGPVGDWALRWNRRELKAEKLSSERGGWPNWSLPHEPSETHPAQDHSLTQDHPSLVEPNDAQDRFALAAPSGGGARSAA
ncbi:MAG: hypothetical protein AAF661_07830 [Pseudomonadota bacterium]